MYGTCFELAVARRGGWGIPVANQAGQHGMAIAREQLDLVGHCAACVALRGCGRGRGSGSSASERRYVQNFGAGFCRLWRCAHRRRDPEERLLMLWQKLLHCATDPTRDTRRYVERL